MRDRWESDSLRWIHTVREERFRRTSRKRLAQLSSGPSREAQALMRKLDLPRAPLRPEARLAAKVESDPRDRSRHRRAAPG